MTVAEILANEELRRNEFPVCQQRNFLAHAAVCALPRRVAEAMTRCALEGSRDDQEIRLAKLLAETRGLAAKLLHATAEEVALVGPTSLGLSIVAAGLSFRRNDNIVVYFDDYPSNVYPWMALAEQGVKVRFLNTRSLGQIRPHDVMGQVDENTRLVALASCHFLSGWRIDHAAIGKELRQRGILFCVDAIQTLGAFPTTVEHIDFLAADAHKWLLGPCAAGLLYVRRELQNRLRPRLYGWHNVLSPDFIAQEQIEFRPDCRRYEPGTHNIIGIAGLHAAMELLLEAGIENISAELLRKRRWLVTALKDAGWTILHAEVPESNQGAMLSFTRTDCDLPALHQRLADAGITVSLRTDRAGKKYLRASPHFYNTDAELQALMTALAPV